MSIPFYVQAAWFAGALLFIFGLKGMSSPTTARRGIVWAGVGMLVAIIGTFLVPHLNNIGLMLLALVVGASAAWISGKKVQMTDMPQMVAIYNGMGGGAAAAIAAIEFAKGEAHSTGTLILAVLGALIGAGIVMVAWTLMHQWLSSNRVERAGQASTKQPFAPFVLTGFAGSWFWIHQSHELINAMYIVGKYVYV